MTEKNYYTDSYKTEFESIVTRIERTGEKYTVALDNTYFYPTSGGQEHDLGEISGIRIDSVLESENGDIFHFLAFEPSFAVGDKITGKIDWNRRFENMQQHTGQHLLSAAFENLFGIKTHSSRLGNDVATLDLSTEKLSDSQIHDAEQLTNRIIWENRPVKIHFATSDTIQSFKLRVLPKVIGTIRILEVPEFDLTPCGGTHVKQTCEVGIVKVIRTEKLKQGITRLDFHCGQRVLRDYHFKNQLVTYSVQVLSVPQPRLIEKIERIISDSKEKDKELAALRSELAQKEAREIIKSLPTSDHLMEGSFSLWFSIYENLRPESFQTYAETLRKQTKCFGVLALVGNNKVQVVVTRSPDLGFDCNALLRQLLSHLQSGKGGGKVDNAQGGGTWAGKISDLSTAFRSELNTFLSTKLIS
ncbi:MAG: DHHA1 domain-containing protein [Chloroherpetonaceae bacterium]|nr:DHHA1 domain-containing protein [Chloroherpetonaceae bacterium]